MDSNDFNAWQAGYGTTVSALMGDGDVDTDGDVDGNDFLICQQEYGSVSDMPFSGNIPEPASLILHLRAPSLMKERTNDQTIVH